MRKNDYFTDPEILNMLRECNFSNSQLDMLTYESGPYDITVPCDSLKRLIDTVIRKHLTAMLSAPVTMPADAAVATTVSAPCEHTTDDGNCWCGPTFHDGVWVHNRTDN